MARVTALGYVGIGVSDLAAWENFATQVLGLANAGQDSNGATLFTMDDRDVRIVASPSGEDDIICAGWEVADASELDALGAQLVAGGVDVTEGSADDLAARQVEKMIVCADPDGVRSEIYCGPRNGERGFTSPAGVSGFVAGDQGFGHMVLGSADSEAKLDFYQNKLGLMLSDQIHMEMGPGVTITANFFHCNPRHHTLAILPAPLPKKLHHLMVQANTLDDVGRALDLAKSNNVPFASELGKHTNDHMVSFYVVTPSGFEVEFGYGGREIDDDTWQVDEYDAISLWGHHRVEGP